MENITFYGYVGVYAQKNRLIIVIYQSIKRRISIIPGVNPDLQKVLFTDPTGKAAFGFEGYTLNALFSLPFNQYSGELHPLSSVSVNSILTKLGDVKLIINYR